MSRSIRTRPTNCSKSRSQEWARAVSAEEIEHQRNIELPALKPFATLDDQLQATANLENAIRHFLTRQGLLTVPPDMPHYAAKPVPTYLQGMDNFGELDDFTGPSRLTQDSVRWTEKPSLNPGYFEGATQRDPRPLIVHEGVPGHYMQLWLSWKNPDPIRRHYYDSGCDEGLGFYAEEMMLLAGLFDDSPHSREIIYNFMRLRALRVEVDVKLALGQMNNEQAAAYLAKSVPMNPKTAQAEAAMFRHATRPGDFVSDWEDSDHEVPGRCAHQSRRQVRSEGVPRFRLEQRERSDRTPARGVVWRFAVGACGRADKATSAAAHSETLQHRRRKRSPAAAAARCSTETELAALRQARMSHEPCHLIQNEPSLN